ncbi:MAG: electron transport complex subunit RsxE [Oscillospiraceae bacterium]|nr:electron transport complex subunit RsxE [Oscillospiraceae bacterium]
MGQTTRQFKEGIVTRNPIFVLLLGMCPALAVTTTVRNGIGMGIAVALALLGSNITISLLRNLIPKQVRIVCYAMIIVTFVSVVDMLFRAYFPQLAITLGIYIPLIAVNCVILGRAEMYASKNSVMRSAIDGLAVGVGFIFALMAVGSIREIMAHGTWLDRQILPSRIPTVALMGMPAGAFLAMGFAVAAGQYFVRRRRKRRLYFEEVV